MSDKEYLDRAIDFIVELLEDDPTTICDKLHEYPEEDSICAADCQDLDHFCIMRYLEHYGKKK